MVPATSGVLPESSRALAEALVADRMLLHDGKSRVMQCREGVPFLGFSFQAMAFQHKHMLKLERERRDADRESCHASLYRHGGNCDGGKPFVHPRGALA